MPVYGTWHGKMEKTGPRTPPREITVGDYIDLGEYCQGAEIAELETLVDDGRACPDCGEYIGRYYGPVDFDGQRYGGGDWVCRPCASARGVVTHG